MPTYQYECDDCQYAFEALQSMLDDKLKKCPQCGELKLHRLIGTGAGVIFKGSGFYETDYKKKPSHSSSSASGSQSTEKSSSSDKKKAQQGESGGGGSSASKKDDAG